MTLPGRDRSAPRIIMGSHLDSVPQGGNFDGAAGVVAGLCVLSALKRARFVPDYDLTVMASAPRSPPGSTSPIWAAAARSDCSIPPASRFRDPTTARASKRP